MQISASRKRKLCRVNYGYYVNNQFNRRPLITFMTKIRSTQVLVTSLETPGLQALLENKFKGLIKEAMGDNLKNFFTQERLTLLEKALEDAERKTQPDEKVWVLRMAVDAFYDMWVNDYNCVDIAKPPSLQVLIKNTINEMSKFADNKQWAEETVEAMKLLKEIKSKKIYLDLLSPGAIGLLNDAIAKMEDAKEAKIKYRICRSTLDRLYNEVRLPEVFSPRFRPQVARKKDVDTKGELVTTKNDHALETATRTLILNFADKNGFPFKFTIHPFGDKILGGQSVSYVEIDEDNKYLKLYGIVSRSNRGGFASFRIVPNCKIDMQYLLRDATEIILEVKNLDKQNSTYKLQMINESKLKSFNWQSEFEVEPDEDFHVIRLNIASFWPTMFGQVMSAPGNVEISKVDCLGIIISHVTMDGKENTNFVEGTYGLAIRSIYAVKSKEIVKK